MSNKEGLKTAILLIDNRKAEIKKDLEILNKAKKLLGDDAVTIKYANLVDISCELTILKGDMVDLL